mmetsp:Transcript_151/g.246  ORF Transcript_151/g.246 Transcript_151/m.246 type:complete len:140 (+) Transcript_151:1660-2079(+)
MTKEQVFKVAIFCDVKLNAPELRHYQVDFKMFSCWECAFDKASIVLKNCAQFNMKNVFKYSRFFFNFSIVCQRVAISSLNPDSMSCFLVHSTISPNRCSAPNQIEIRVSPSSLQFLCPTEQSTHDRLKLETRKSYEQTA